MRIVFLGSGDLACPALRGAAEEPAHTVELVISQPDRPSGRKRRPAACPVKKLVVEMNLPVATPERIAATQALDQIRALSPDLGVVAAYGQFLPRALLEIPRHGFINIHPSLLPRYRGAAPIQWALANGDKTTGVTILYVTARMDAGDIILREPYMIEPHQRTAELEPILAERGAELMLKAIAQIENGTADRIPQREAEATRAPKLTKEDGRMDFNLPAATLHNRARGLYPWPCCYCQIEAGADALLKVLRTRPEPGQEAPGQVLDIDKEGPLIATGNGALRLLEVQPPGKKPMSGADFCRGYRLKPKHRFG